MYQGSRPRNHPFVGLGFGVFILLSPMLGLFAWLFGDWHRAVVWASWCATVGIVMMMTGHLLGYGFMKSLKAFTTMALFPAVGFMYAYGSGNSWAWLLGWSIFGIGVVQAMSDTLRLRKPRVLSYEYARDLASGSSTVPYAARLMMVYVAWAQMVSLGTYLVLANVGISGYLATSAPLAIWVAATLLSLILHVRFRKQLLREHGR